MGFVMIYCLFVVGFVTDINFTNGFSTDRLLVNTVHYPLTTVDETPLEPETAAERQTGSKHDTEQINSMLKIAFNALQEEKLALGDLVATVKSQSDSEMKRLEAVTDIIEEYASNKPSAPGTGTERIQTVRGLVDGYENSNGSILKMQGVRRRHRKRSAFDSISHNGGLGGLGQAESERERGKLPFTFQNLLPYLLNEQRRNNRATRRRRD